MHALQLDQLRLAVRSPDRAAVEDDDCVPGAAALLQIHQLAALVQKVNVREDFPDPWTTLPIIGFSPHIAP